MYLGVPQIIYLAFTLVGLGISAAKHGQEKKGQENVWATLIVTCFIYGLLYWGGFFSQ